MSEIEKYLMKREEPQKPKILIVDDSMTIRQGMKELLCEDYEIALAKSGMSAIQSISLDKPDLILLDYEMPVCDGRQVLQMIRSEEDFAALPVFFLTGRTDPESVKKVISLKPEGYLSTEKCLKTYNAAKNSFGRSPKLFLYPHIKFISCTNHNSPLSSSESPLQEPIHP